MNSPTRAACTIVSRNYLPYARTLCTSFMGLHPDYKFYILVVDSPDPLRDRSEPCEVLYASEIGIETFSAIAFKYDIVELNTAVKPSFLKFLMQERNATSVLYFDPDIFIYRDTSFIFDELEKSSVVLTPHVLHSRELPSPADRQLLRSGVFNLGFVGVANSREGRDFLEWWERRCLEMGFNDPRNGLFVDQKWIDYVPCLFSAAHILRDVGCNVAYWNVEGRLLRKTGDQWHVNEDTPLVFFHFSGVRIDGGDELSKYSTITLTRRPDLCELVRSYREALTSHGLKKMSTKYAYGQFSDGTPITKLARIVYSLHYPKRFGHENPFDASSEFYRYAKRARLLSHTDSSDRYTSHNYNHSDCRIRFVHLCFRTLLRLLGADKYTMAMKYLSFISILRNQRDVFEVV